jgi:uncharacterized repeat protein (TIGR03803 family)
MKSLDSYRYAVSIGVAAATLAGCGSQLPIGAPGALPQNPALSVRINTNYKVVHSFGAVRDGSSPIAPLIDVGGTLYGTTYVGGKYNGGTVFSLTPRGVEKVLHNFGSGSDGVKPNGLIDVSGTLYGTTYEGGSYTCYRDSYGSGCGTVFSITLTGAEKVLHSFSGSARGGDGRFPAAPLINVNGTLYGTTSEGGAYYSYYGGGTVFAITKAGTETVLHTFNVVSGDGQDPQAGLVYVNGTLYGTTSAGGASYWGGTVFSVTLSGKERVLHSFGYGADGAIPAASLINVKGTLYGTTALGGTMGCHGYGFCGTIFSITPGGIGTEKVLHGFLGKPDGGSPFAPLIEVKGTLYGTTVYGGVRFCSVGDSCGTVFSITPSGAEKVLHSFGGKSDGVYPDAAVTEVNGKLYGTTQNGGAFGLGTVFELTP